MPQKKRKMRLPPDDREVEVSVTGFQVGGEHWNEYLLDDGSVIKIKVIVTEVVRVEGEYDPQGNPAYFVQSQQVVAVSSPDELMRKEGD